MAFLLETFLGDGTLLEEEKRSHTLQMQLLPNQVLSIADERGARGGKENMREVQIRWTIRKSYFFTLPPGSLKVPRYVRGNQ